MNIASGKYKKIMEDYSRRRNYNRQSALRRRDRLYLDIPAFKKLDDEIADISVEKAKLIIKGISKSPWQVQLELREKLDQLRSQKDELLQEAGLPSDYLEVHYDCKKCSDTGFYDGKPCECLSRRIIEELYEQSNIKEVLEKENFTKLTYKYYNDSERSFMEDMVREAKRFVSSFDSSSKGMLLFGNTGSGKTFISNCISKELLDSGHSVIYFTSYALFDFLARHTFGRDENARPESLPDDIFGCDLLVIDDLGSETVNSFVSSQLFLILNERHQRGRSTIISTNLNLQQIQDIYSERCSSRIIADFNFYHFCGRDMRPLMKGIR